MGGMIQTVISVRCHADPISTLFLNTPESFLIVPIDGGWPGIPTPRLSPQQKGEIVAQVTFYEKPHSHQTISTLCGRWKDAGLFRRRGSCLDRPWSIKRQWNHCSKTSEGKPWHRSASHQSLFLPAPTPPGEGSPSARFFFIQILLFFHIALLSSLQRHVRSSALSGGNL